MKSNQVYIYTPICRLYSSIVIFCLSMYFFFLRLRVLFSLIRRSTSFALLSRFRQISFPANLLNFYFPRNIPKVTFVIVFYHFLKINEEPPCPLKLIWRMHFLICREHNMDNESGRFGGNFTITNKMAGDQKHLFGESGRHTGHWKAVRIVVVLKSLN